MAKPDLGAIADRLLRGFMAPLVLGGPMTPGRPIGARAALALGEERVAGDPDLLAHVELARVRCARAVVAIDRLPAATAAEWALAAALHDLVQTTHPSMRKSSAARLLDLARTTVERVPAPANLAEALSRHTWFARTLEIARTDSVVSWWVGKSTFLGEEPPGRLLAWPELRRVHVDKTARALMELPAPYGAVEPIGFAEAIARFLARTPLTDLATSARAAPVFAWSAETLALVASIGGRALVTRALAREPAAGIDAALGAATRALLARGAFGPAKHALDLLAERALADALAPTVSRAGDARSNDVAFARAAGALVARESIARGELLLGDEDQRKRALAVLETTASTAAATEVRAALGAGEIRTGSEGE